jgi:hypothetical protein
MRITNTFTCVFQAFLPPSCSQMRKKKISKNSSRARNKVVREIYVPPRPRLSPTVVCNENSTLHKTTRHSMTPDEKLCSPSLLSKLATSFPSNYPSKPPQIAEFRLSKTTAKSSDHQIISSPHNCCNAIEVQHRSPTSFNSS